MLTVRSSPSATASTLALTETPSSLALRLRPLRPHLSIQSQLQQEHQQQQQQQRQQPQPQPQQQLQALPKKPGLTDLCLEATATTPAPRQSAIVPPHLQRPPSSSHGSAGFGEQGRNLQTRSNSASTASVSAPASRPVPMTTTPTAASPTASPTTTSPDALPPFPLHREQARARVTHSSQPPSSKPRTRTMLQPAQIAALEELFGRDPFPTVHQRKVLAVAIRIPTKVVDVWFANRRRRERRFPDTTLATTKATAIAQGAHSTTASLRNSSAAVTCAAVYASNSSCAAVAVAASALTDLAIMPPTPSADARIPGVHYDKRRSSKETSSALSPSSLSFHQPATTVSLAASVPTPSTQLRRASIASTGQMEGVNAYQLGRYELLRRFSCAPYVTSFDSLQPPLLVPAPPPLFNPDPMYHPAQTFFSSSYPSIYPYPLPVAPLFCSNPSIDDLAHCYPSSSSYDSVASSFDDTATLGHTSSTTSGTSGLHSTNTVTTRCSTSTSSMTLLKEFDYGATVTDRPLCYDPEPMTVELPPIRNCDARSKSRSLMQDLMSISTLCSSTSLSSPSSPLSP